MDGIIHVRDVNEIIDACNNLTISDFETKLLAIEDNYHRSLEYLSQSQVLERKLREVFIL